MPRSAAPVALLALILPGASCSTNPAMEGTGGSDSAWGGDRGNTSGGGTDSPSSGSAQSSGGDTQEGSGGTTQAVGGAPGGGGEATVERMGGAPGSGGRSGAPSEGCQTTQAVESGRFTIVVDGTDREYIVKLPEAYDPSRPHPLIFGWHGRMYDAEWVANGEPPLTGPYFGIEAEAGGEAIFVAPQALSTGWSNEGGRDIAFTKAMLSRFEAELCIDTSRVFSAGFSFGAMMTIGIGCELADKFRAIAPMSGSLGNGCPEPRRPMAYWTSHGLSDTTIRPEQGEAARDEFIARNHCDSASLPTEREGCLAYENCDTGYPVTWCTFDGAHEPPPYAGSAIWSFFKQF